MEYRVLHYLFTRVGLLLESRGVGSTVAVIKYGTQSYCGSGLLAEWRSSLICKVNITRDQLRGFSLSPY